MHPEYKRVKLYMPHCPSCKQQLIGDNSIVSPWECGCGTWEAKYPFTGEYDILTNK